MLSGEHRNAREPVCDARREFELKVSGNLSRVIMVTIKKVAKAAGVSVGTASNVLTGAVPVSEALRRRVQEAIRGLDFVPNRAAGSLRSHRTRALGILVPDISDPYTSCIVRGASRAARAHDYSLFAVDSGSGTDQRQELHSLLRSRLVDGILLVPDGSASTGLITQVQEFPIVVLDHVPGECGVDSVSVENAEAARVATEHLIGGGNRRIAIVTGPLTMQNEAQRLSGYRQALRDGKIRFYRTLCWEGSLSHGDVTVMVQGRIGLFAGPPDAILCTNRSAAIGVLQALQMLELSIPGDVAVVAFDVLAGNDPVWSSITTVTPPAHDIGHRGVELLLNRIARGNTMETVALRLPATLQIRESSSQLVAA